MDYDRHLMTEIEKEEALMEAEDIKEAKIDALTEELWPSWYQSENDFEIFMGDLPTMNPGLFKELYLQVCAKDSPALKNLDDGFETWCRERAREEAEGRMCDPLFG